VKYKTKSTLHFDIWILL